MQTEIVAIFMTCKYGIFIVAKLKGQCNAKWDRSLFNFHDMEVWIFYCYKGLKAGTKKREICCPCHMI